MSTSDRSGTGVRPSRYDLILAIIPSAFVLAWALSATAGPTLQQSLVAASVVGTFAMIDALFLNPPGGPRGGRVRGT